MGGEALALEGVGHLRNEDATPEPASRLGPPDCVALEGCRHDGGKRRGAK